MWILDRFTFVFGFEFFLVRIKAYLLFTVLFWLNPYPQNKSITFGLAL